MNFAQLEYFLAVARYRKFCDAAEHAYISQSSLSKQIKALEEELSVELFVRGAHGTSLTPAGEAFLEFAERTSREHEDILLRLEQFTSSAQFRVRVGALPLVGAYGLHADLADFQVDDMSTQIDFIERSQAELIAQMGMHHLDVAIVRTDNLSRDEYDWVDLVRDEMVIVCSNQHPLARRGRVRWDQLKNERFVTLEPKSALYVLFVDECRRRGFFPNIIFTHARHEMLVAAVSRNIGITALPYGLTQGRNETLVSCANLDEPIFTSIGLVWPRTAKLTPTAAKLIEHFRKLYPTEAVAEIRDVSVLNR